MELIALSFLKNLRKINESTISYLMGRFGLASDVKRVTENTLVVILTTSIFISLLIGLTVMILALGSLG
jgi:hypothetical protein